MFDLRKSLENLYDILLGLPSESMFCSTVITSCLQGALWWQYAEEEV